MTSKKLVVLAGAAAVLVGLAYLSGQRNALRTPAAHGRKLFPELDVSKVAAIEIARPSGETLALAAADAGWTIDSLHGYPADLVKIRENVLKLADLKAGHEAPDRAMAGPTTVRLKDAAGQILAELALGEQHLRKPSDDMPGFGGYPDGRYVSVGGKDAVYLVDDALASLDGDASDWADMQIPSPSGSTIQAIEISNAGADLALVKTNGAWTVTDLGADEEMDSGKLYSLDSALSYLRFNGIAAPALTDDALGFATGTVYRAVYADGITYTAHVGAPTTNSQDRAFRIAASFAPTGTNAAENAAAETKVAEFNGKAGKWTYLVAPSTAQKFTLARTDLVKPKAKPETEAAPVAELAKEAAEAPHAEPATDETSAAPAEASPETQAAPASTETAPQP
ncbi:MAG: DUF4340 domain-containing protein [Kiritimatiellae bacterium]|nr:DUF4340 domain-containing protein [Kiritimatiellia bacterium]